MELEKEIARKVRELPDKKLVAMALKTGFSVALKSPVNGSGASKPRAPSKPSQQLSEDSIKAARDLIKDLVADKGRALGIGEICTLTNMSRQLVKSAIDSLVAGEVLFKAGKARGTVYGMSQEMADRAVGA